MGGAQSVSVAVIMGNEKCVQFCREPQYRLDNNTNNDLTGMGCEAGSNGGLL